MMDKSLKFNIQDLKFIFQTSLFIKFKIKLIKSGKTHGTVLYVLYNRRQGLHMIVTVAKNKYRNIHNGVNYGGDMLFQIFITLQSTKVKSLTSCLEMKTL